MDPFLFVIPGFLLFVTAFGLWADDKDRRRRTAEEWTMSRVDELRALAKKATPGPWSSEGMPYVCGPDGDAFADVKWNPGRDSDEYADAAYIAAVDPQTVLAILDVAEQMAREHAHHAIPGSASCHGCALLARLDA